MGTIYKCHTELPRRKEKEENNGGRKPLPTSIKEKETHWPEEP